MAKVGRRTKCTPELTREICAVLRTGNYIEVACDYVGLGVSTYYEWVTRGEAELERVGEDLRRSIRSSEEVFVEFAEATTRARRAAEIESVARIRKAAEEDWRADAWYLERSHAERWGKRLQKVEHAISGVDSIKIDFNIPGVEPDEDDGDA